MLAESVSCLSHIRQRFGKGQVKVGEPKALYPSGVCQGCQWPRCACLTGGPRDKPQATARHGFGLMPVAQSVKVWSKYGRTDQVMGRPHGIAKIGRSAR